MSVIVHPGPSEGVEIVRGMTRAAALLHPERRRILEALIKPNSASGIARKFGIPRQQATYHLRELEKVGLLELVEETRRGNCTERIVRATARTYVISQEALGKLGEEAATRKDRSSVAYLVAAAAKLIREMTLVMARSVKLNREVRTIAVEAEIAFGSGAERADFARELVETVAKLTAKYHKPGDGTRTYKVLIGAYPALAANEEGDDQQSVRIPEY